MRIPQPRRTNAAAKALPEDASGHVWDADRYRANDDGTPVFTKSGNYWPRPGRSHAK